MEASPGGIIRFVWLIPLFPLLGFLANGLLGWKLGKRFVSLVGCGTVFLSFLIAAGIFVQVSGFGPEARIAIPDVIKYTWISSGDFVSHVGFRVDPLSIVMMLVVTGVGFLIHVYSIGYMGHDTGYPRFFAYMNLFTFSMLMLVTANNLLLLFVGWEGVGLCSYLLIGYFYQKPSAAAAGKKAFVVNRVGDFGFLLGMLLIYWRFGTLDFSKLAEYVPLAVNAGQVAPAVITTITLLLFVGAAGKSAQIPLYVWLPDAMEGPTPVSALIHAATMVTSGVYMISRLNFLYAESPFTLTVVAIIGALTAVFAATIGLVQNDIKRVLAYSTISQLGYMFLGCGVGAFSAGMFHLTTHAFFKACLFLGAGSVMHALSGELDMRKMGALKAHLPSTYRTFLLATLAIAGIVPFAGFFSKDEILLKAFAGGKLIPFALGLIGALLTAFYMFRLFFNTFHGSSRVDPEVAHHVHESPRSMTIPLWILGILSLVGGLIGIPGYSLFEKWLEPVFARSAEKISWLAREGHGVSTGLEAGLMIASLAVAVIGIYIAMKMYAKTSDAPARLAARFKRLYTLLLNKYYVDELYWGTIVNPLKKLSTFFWEIFDDIVIDGTVNLVGIGVQVNGEIVRITQSGRVRNYALFLFMGAVLVILLCIF
jgi:NADH-quinone oxidoreductase subunit L